MQSTVNHDTLKVVTDYPITEYRCAVRAGDQVRLKHDLHIRDSRGRPTGKVHPAGERWIVLRGAADEPVVIWLRQPDGETHTWNVGEEFLAAFEIISA